MMHCSASLWRFSLWRCRKHQSVKGSILDRLTPIALPAALSTLLQQTFNHGTDWLTSTVSQSAQPFLITLPVLLLLLPPGTSKLVSRLLLTSHQSSDWGLISQIPGITWCLLRILQPSYWRSSFRPRAPRTKMSCLSAADFILSRTLKEARLSTDMVVELKLLEPNCRPKGKENTPFCLLGCNLSPRHLSLICACA